MEIKGVRLIQRQNNQSLPFRPTGKKISVSKMIHTMIKEKQRMLIKKNPIVFKEKKFF